MKDTNLATQTIVLLLISTLFAISFSYGILPAQANPDDIYLQWEGDDPEVGGFLTIASFPAVLEVGKTYRITATFSLEKLGYADAVEFGRIEWTLYTPDGYYPIGYSSLDANLTKHQQDSTISHWGIKEKPPTGWGILKAIAEIRLHNSTEPGKAVQTIRIFPPIEVTLRVESVLRMNPVPFDVEQGHAIQLKGTLTSYQVGATTTVDNKTISDFDRPKIDLILTDPNGNQITRSIIADIYGNFAYEFRPNVTGIWYVTASYNGSSYFFPSTSNMVSIRVRYQFSWAALLAIISLLSLVVGPPLLKKIKVHEWKTPPS